MTHEQYRPQTMWAMHTSFAANRAEALQAIVAMLAFWAFTARPRAGVVWRVPAACALVVFALACFLADDLIQMVLCARRAVARRARRAGGADAGRRGRA